MYAAARVRQAWTERHTTFNCWLSSPSPITAELIAGIGFDTLLLDLQHGFAGISDVLAIRQATATGSAALLTRVAACDEAVIGRLLDYGVDGVVCPMVNTGHDAESFVRACAYPPRGIRSWGPFHAAPGVTSAEYFRTAADRVLTIAQIETAEAVANVSDIVRTPGLDAILVGPADLSISMGRGPSIDYQDEALASQHRCIEAAARLAGVHLMAIALTAEDIPLLTGWGAVALSVASDLGAVVPAATEALARARSAAPRSANDHP
jgi:4-hydroxy-2-oxoheptanedioate aldolase